MKEKILTTCKILQATSSPESQELLRIIDKGEDSYDLVVKGKMTRKQYYLRLAKLVEMDLVKRAEGKYKITIFGKVIYETHLRLAVVVNNRFKLRALELLYSTSTIPVSERSKLMDQIINDTGKTEIILKYDKPRIQGAQIPPSRIVAKG